MKLARSKSVVLLVIGVLLIGAAAACGDDDDSDDGNNGPEVTPTTPTSASNGADNGNDDEVQEIEVLMYDNYFEPKEITIPVGTVVKIEAKNEGMAIHNMVILDTEFSSDAMVTAGDSSEFEVMFSEAGTYDFQCDYHVPDMVGTITVQ